MRELKLADGLNLEQLKIDLAKLGYVVEDGLLKHRPEHSTRCACGAPAVVRFDRGLWCAKCAVEKLRTNHG